MKLFGVSPFPNRPASAGLMMFAVATAAASSAAAQSAAPILAADAVATAADTAAASSADELVVTTKRNRAPNLKDVAGNSTVITADHIERGRISTVADALKYEPGLLAQSATGTEATRMKLQDLLLSVAARHGATLLVVTHDIGEAVYLRDRVLALSVGPGRISGEVAVRVPRPRDRRDPELARLQSEVLSRLDGARAA